MRRCFRRAAADLNSPGRPERGKAIEHRLNVEKSIAIHFLRARSANMAESDGRLRLQISHMIVF
jgi:hypothetical protein